MNWLAHLLLAEPDPASRLGNLLGDLVKGEERKTLNTKLQRGLKCHQEIDVFTDQHSIVKLSKQRISPEYRRFAGILIDVFYDYILANNWNNYSKIPLAVFTTNIYSSWTNYLIDIPPYSQVVIHRLVTENWLYSYRHIAGIEATLASISYRLNRRRKKRHYDLTPSIKELTTNYGALESDFQEFFPELQSHIDRWHQKLYK